MEKMPAIGVILPVFNGELYIKDAVESILDQTFNDFTLYVIDDGSTDNTMHILKQFTDPRLNIVSNGTNKGLIYTLNKGLELTKHFKYIARMDADDISLPHRFEKQFNFLEENTKIDVLGTAVQVFGEAKDRQRLYWPQTSAKIASAFMFSCPVTHPTVMIRGEKLTQQYSYDFPKYEDYHLWIKVFREMNIYNLNDLLLKYRRHGSNVTATYGDDALKDHGDGQRLISVFADETGIALTQEEIATISIITGKVRYHINPDFSIKYLYNVLNSTKGKLNDYFDKDYYNYLFQERMFLYFLRNKKYKNAFIVISKMNIRNKKRFINAFYCKEKN